MDEIILGLGIIFAILLGSVIFLLIDIVKELKQITHVNETQMKNQVDIARLINIFIKIQKEYNTRTR